MGIYQLTDMLNLLLSNIRAIGTKILHPLLMDLFRPLRTEEARQCQSHEQVLATQLSAEAVVRFYKDITIPSVGVASTRLPINAIVDEQRLPDGRLRVTLRVIDPDQP